MTYALSKCSEQDRTNFMAAVNQYFEAKLTAKHVYTTKEDALRRNASLPSIASPPLPGDSDSAMIIDHASTVSTKPTAKKCKLDVSVSEIIPSTRFMQEGPFEPQPAGSEPYSNGGISSMFLASSIMQQPVVSNCLPRPLRLAADQVYEDMQGCDGGMWRTMRSEHGGLVETRILEEADI